MPIPQDDICYIEATARYDKDTSRSKRDIQLPKSADLEVLGKKELLIAADLKSYAERELQIKRESSFQ